MEIDRNAFRWPVLTEEVAAGTKAASLDALAREEIAKQRDTSAHPRDLESGLLTDRELAAAELAGRLWSELCQVVGPGPTRGADLGELVVHIHAIQQAVLSQAAARAYPDRFRLLGESLRLAAVSDSPVDSREQ